MLSIGLMSGTSMDSIDAALIESDGEQQIKEIAHTSLPYDSQFKTLLKAAEYSAHQHQGNLKKVQTFYNKDLQDYLLKELNLSPVECKSNITFNEVIQHSTELHAAVVKQLLQENSNFISKIDVIGYPGQTLFHDPSNKITVQIGDGQRLANLLRITVVNDFRSRDVGLGGQGAPFAPLYHQALAIRDKIIPAAIVNCGGIANISIVTGVTANDVFGFDTGPGNGLIDRLIRQRTQGKQSMDKDGHYAKQGKVDEKVLQELYEQAPNKNGKNYFSLWPPKSLDINDFQLTQSFAKLSLEDACATLAAFTADTIVKSLNHVKIKPRHWVLSGGGWKNPVIMNELKLRLVKEIPDVKIIRASDINWNSDAIEAQTFAYLAVRSLKKLPLSYPNTTGVSVPSTGGHIYFAQDLTETL